MDYSTVTEATGTRVSREALSMLYTRYRTALTFCDGKDVLEVACGAGQGLGYLASKAGRTIGGDYTDGLLRLARRHYGHRVPLIRLDAQALPFRERSFDVVLLYEALYYLAQPDAFLAESRRVLRDHGIVLICTANREWPDFNPSPFSAKYFSAQELHEWLLRQGFKVELYGAFPVVDEAASDRLVSLLKRLATRLHLIPKTMRGKEVLKRLFFGKLASIPSEVIDGMAELAPLVPLSGTSIVRHYKVLYAVGRLQ
jgi:ubiquinone/menaquinone biosynthesis C-methylase UbiE